MWERLYYVQGADISSQYILFKSIDYYGLDRLVHRNFFLARKYIVVLYFTSLRVFEYKHNLRK